LPWSQDLTAGDFAPPPWPSPSEGGGKGGGDTLDDIFFATFRLRHKNEPKATQKDETTDFRLKTRIEPQRTLRDYQSSRKVEIAKSDFRQDNEFPENAESIEQSTKPKLPVSGSGSVTRDL
jgi:hypothetical protein